MSRPAFNEHMIFLHAHATLSAFFTFPVSFASERGRKRGSSDDVTFERIIKGIKINKVQANGLFKDRGQPPVAQYVFNGVAFDHNAHTVCLGPRVIRKLRADSFFNISFVDLEAVVGRLIYGSAVLRLNMPRFYFALKVAQRRINLLNRCPKLCDRPVALPVVTRSMLAEWRNELLENVPRSPPPHPDVVPHKHRLYTDASVKGWGAIMYLDSGEVLITGEAWPESSSYEVNRAEAAAVRLALEKFSAHCPRGTCLDVFVDNTSCQAALNRRISKSEGVSMELREVLRLTEDKGICVKAAYISTADAVIPGGCCQSREGD